jgi:hypothetical protein
LRKYVLRSLLTTKQPQKQRLVGFVVRWRNHYQPEERAEYEFGSKLKRDERFGHDDPKTWILLVHNGRKQQQHWQ